MKKNKNIFISAHEDTQKNVLPRKDFVFEKVDFSEIKE